MNIRSWAALLAWPVGILLAVLWLTWPLLLAFIKPTLVVVPAVVRVYGVGYLVLTLVFLGVVLRVIYWLGKRAGGHRPLVVLDASALLNAAWYSDPPLDHVDDPVCDWLDIREYVFTQVREVVHAWRKARLVLHVSYHSEDHLSNLRTRASEGDRGWFDAALALASTLVHLPRAKDSENAPDEAGAYVDAAWAHADFFVTTKRTLVADAALREKMVAKFRVPIVTPGELLERLHRESPGWEGSSS